MFSSQSHTYFQTRRWISCLILLTFLFSDLARAQGLEKPSTSLIPYEDQKKTREEGFVSLEEFEAMEAREKFLEEQRQNLQLLRKESEVRNQKLIEEQNRSLQEAMELQKLIEQQKGMNIRGKADEIKSRISQAGERYILYKDGKKVTFRGGLTIKVENEKVKDKLGNVSIRNTVDMQYDKKNQLVSYNQETKDPLGSVTRVEWRNGTYWTKADQSADPLKVAGKLSGYSETIYEPTGLVTTRNWSEIRHYTKETEKLNPAHVADQLASYRVESVGNDAPAAPRVTEFSNAEYARRPATPTATDTKKEDDILLTKFHEKSTVLGVTTERDFFDAQYNEHEQLVSYRETSTTMGVTTDKEWKNATYDELGRLNSFDEITKTEGVTTVRHFRDAEYNSLGQLISYTEVRSTQGLTTITKFSEATYDQFGRLSSYKNVITENGVTYTQIRKEIEYNAQGQVTGYFDIVERLGMTTETRRSNITYDAFGRMFSYIDQIHEFGGGLDRTIKVVREQTQYNKLGQELGYKETTWEPNGLIREVTRSNQKYNALGQLVSFYEVVRERGSVQQMVAILDVAGNVILDANGNPMTRLETVAIDRTIQRYFRNAIYDGLGRLVSYEEEVRDSTRPGVVVVRQRFDQVYDGQGRVVSYKERETTTGMMTDAATGQTLSLNQTVFREKRDVVYNALGQEVAYFERLTDATGQLTERYFFDAQYNSLGQLTSYKERISVNGETLVRERSQILVDSLGRVVSYVEVTTDLFGVKTTTFRKSTLYNGFDQETGFFEEVTRSGQGVGPDGAPIDLKMVEKRIRLSATYNGFGQLTAYTDENIDYLGVKNRIEFKDAIYNELGQLLASTEVVKKFGEDLTSTSMPKLEMEITRKLSNVVYNANRQRVSYVEETLYQDAVRQFSEKTVRQGTTYNAAGQVETFVEVVTSDAEPGKTVTRERIRTEYNAYQVPLAWEERLVEKGLDSDGNLVLDKSRRVRRDGIQYDALGREVAFLEKVTGENGNALEGTTQRLSSRYNALNQLIASSEKLTRSDAPSLVTQRDLSSVVYNSFGYQEKFEETITESGPGVSVTTVRRRLSTSYNSAGLVTSLAEETQELDAAGGAVAPPHWTESTTRDNFSYDTFGRETGFHEIVADRFGIVRGRTRSNVGYNSVGQEITFDEVRSFLNFVETENRVSTAYDLQGRLYGYQSQIKLRGSGLAGDGTPIELEVDRALTRSETLYNEQDQVVRTVDREISSVAPELEVSVERSLIAYNELGLAKEYTETTRQKSLPGAVTARDAAVVVQRSEITYTVRKEAASYIETQVRADAPNLQEKTEFSEAQYDGEGRLVAFTEKQSSNQSSATVERRRSAITYDARNRTATYSETRTRDGQESSGDAYSVVETITRGETVYNDLDQVESYREDFSSTEEPREQKIVWSEGRYNRLGQLLTFEQENRLPDGSLFSAQKREETVYNSFGDLVRTRQLEQSLAEPDVVTEVTLENVVFDAAGRRLSYKETRHRQGANGALDVQSAVTRADIEYNTAGQVISYSEDSVGNGSPSSSTKRFNMTYDSNGDLSSYEEETTTDGAGKKSLERSAIQYNRRGEIVGYRETGVAESTGSYEQERSGMVYSAVGQLLSFHEKGKTASGEYELDRSNMQYGRLGELVAYDEESTTAQAPQNRASQKFYGAAYDSLGRLVSYTQERSSLANATVVTTRRTATQFDALHRESGFTEERTTSDGRVDAVARSAVTYNKKGQLLSYEERIDSSVEPAPRRVVFKDAVYNNEAQLIQFVEETYDLSGTLLERRSRLETTLDTAGRVVDTVDEIFNAAEPDVTTRETISDVTFDPLGNQTGYTQDIVREGAGGAFRQTLRNVRSEIVTNSLGQVVSYKEVSTGDGQPETTRVRHNITYDAKGRMIQFEETTVAAAAGAASIAESVTTVRIRLSTEYNARNQVVKYVETLTQSNEPDFVTTLTTEDITYDTLGREIGFKQTSVRVNNLGGAPVTMTLVRTASQYDNFGRLIGFTQEETSSLLPAVTQVLVRQATVYNRLGQVESTTELRYEKGRGPGDSIEGALTTMTRTFTYDTQQRVATERTVTRIESNLTGLVRETDTLRTDIQYDAAGNIISYVETGTSSAYPGETTRRQFSAAYDAKNRLSTFTEVVQRLDADGAVLSTVTTQRTETVYNDLGQVLRITEERDKNGADKTRLIRSEMVYNDAGQVTSFKEEVWNTSETNPALISSLTQSNMTYNDRGELVSYHEEGNAPSRGGSYVLDRTGQTYDFLGRLGDFHEVLVSGGTTTTTDRSGTRYNGRDLPVAYTETTRTSTNPNEAETLRFDGIIYDNENRMVSFTVEKTSLQSLWKEITIRQSTTFGAKDQITGFVETRRRMVNPAPGDVSIQEILSEEIVTRTNAQYNEKSQLVAYDEVTDRTPLANTDELQVRQDRTTLLFRNAVYDAEGRLLSFTEEERRQSAGEVAETPQIRNWTRDYGFNSIDEVENQFAYYGNPSWQINGGDLVWDNLAPTQFLPTQYLIQGVSLGETQGYTVEIALQLEAVASGGAFTLFWKGSEYGEYFHFRNGSITNGVTGQVYATATTDAIHTYRFVVKNKQIQIYKDGALLSSEGIGSYKFTGFQEPLYLTNVGTRARIASFRYYTGDGIPPVLTMRRFAEDVTVARTRANTYDAQGLLSSWVETTTNSAEPGILNTTTVNNITYDAQKRQTGYAQTTQRVSQPGAPALNVTETTVRNAITYDVKGRVSGSHEERSSTETPDKKVVVDRTAMQYTERWELAQYEENLREEYAGGKTFTTEQAVEMAYDLYGQLASQITYEKITADDALVSVTRRTKNQIVLDPFGVELHSVVTEEDLTQAYPSTVYNAALSQLGSTVAGNNPYNPYAGYVTQFDYLTNGTVNSSSDGLYLNLGAAVTVNLAQPVKSGKVVLGSYLGANQFGGGFRVEVSSDGVNFETVANQSFVDIVGLEEHAVTFSERDVKAVRVTVTSAPTTYFYLSEISVVAARPEANKPKIKEAVAQLDALGLRAKYEMSTRTVRGTNALGQVVSETQIRNKKYEGDLIETVSVARTNQQMNSLGQLVSLLEETSTVMTTWMSFRNLYFYMTSPYPLSVNHGLYNYIGTPQSFDYNGHGHYVGLGYLAPKSWDIYQSSDRTDFTYNANGQVTGYKESGNSRPYGGNYTLTRSAMQYNGRGELSSFSEAGQTQSSGSYSFTRDQIKYGTTESVIASGEGQSPSASTVISYHETGANPQDGPYERTYKVNALDSRGRPIDVEESGAKNAAPYNYHRTNITYNPNEMPFSWHEVGLRAGVTYDIQRRMTRYNNMGQETDRFEEGVRAGGAFWEIEGMIAYDYLGRFFKSGTRSGSSPYYYTYDGTRAYTFYDAEGRVSAYQTYYGPVFVDVTNILYDSYGRIISYTESVRGGSTRQVYGILYDAAGRIVSQKVTDSGAGLLFGNESTYTFSYDEKTGKLLETTITNNDYTMVLDSEGNRKSLTLSARMQAYLAEQEAAARAAAQQERRRASRSRADGRFAPKGAKLISRTEVLEGGSKKSRSKVKAAVGELSLRGDRRSPKQSPKKLKSSLNEGSDSAKRTRQVIKNAKADSRVIARGEATKQTQKILERGPNAEKNQVRRITEVYEWVDDQGRKHRTHETRRVDAEGNLLSRSLVDNFSFRNEQGKKVRARIASTFDSNNILQRTVEKYKQKMKGGTATTKRTTWYDESGNILKQKTKTEFKEKRSFGKILGALLLFGPAGGIWAGLDPSSYSKFMSSGFGKVLNIAVSALAAMTGNVWVIAGTQFSLSLAQTGSLKSAALAAAISVAAYGATKFIGTFLSSIKSESFAGFGKALNTFGKNLSKSMSGGLQAGRNIFNEFAYQTSIRVATQKFSDTFGKKLGVFGTTALLAFTTALAGQALAPKAAGAVPANPVETIGSIAIRAVAQGAIAEGFKNKQGYGAQFLRETLSLSTAGLDTKVLGETFHGVGQSFVQTVSLFNPLSKTGQNNIKFFTSLIDKGINQVKSSIFDKNTGKVLAAEVEILGKKVFMLAPQSKAEMLGLIEQIKERFPGAFSKPESLMQLPTQNGHDALLSSWNKTGAGWFDSISGDIQPTPNQLNSKLNNQTIQRLSDKIDTPVLLDSAMIKNLAGQDKVQTGFVLSTPPIFVTTEANATAILHDYATILKGAALVAPALLLSSEIAGAGAATLVARSLLGGAVNAAYTMMEGASWGDIGASFGAGTIATGVGIKLFGKYTTLGKNIIAGITTNSATQVLTQATLRGKDIVLGETPREFKLTPIILSGIGGAFAGASTYRIKDKILSDVAGYVVSSPFDLAPVFASNSNKLQNSTTPFFTYDFNFPNLNLGNYARQHDNE